MTAPAMMPLFVGGGSASGGAAGVDAGAPALADAVRQAAGRDAGAPAPAERQAKAEARPLAPFKAKDISDEMGEKADAKVKRRPAAPTPREIEEHEASHYPFRSWCRHCVAGSGRLDGHAAVSKDSRDEGIDTIAVDYGYFNDIAKGVTDDTAATGAPATPAAMDIEGKHKTHTPILFAGDRRFGAVFAAVVPEKRRQHPRGWGVEGVYPGFGLDSGQVAE